MLQTCDPFISRFEPPLASETRSGPLLDLTIGVKDGFDIEGYLSGAGSPEWAESHNPATKTSPVVKELMNAGAQIVGKTQMDELAYSLMGVNARYGTPLNPAAPDRVPGGSSSGSAASVAAGLVDIGLGSDTGGSVRLPASFCGIFGWRPTHGLLSGENLVPLAPSYDTPAFFTRELGTMALVASIFASPQVMPETTDLWFPADLWSLAQEPAANALRAALPAGNYRSEPLLPEGGLSDWLTVFQIHQGYEIWQTLGPWISKIRPDFGPGIRERFDKASKITTEAFNEAAARRSTIRAHLENVVTPTSVLVFPTSPGVAPLRSAVPKDLDVFRNAALTMLCVAGHAGLPQLSIPTAQLGGAPLGLSLVGAKGTDAHLISIAGRFPVGGAT